MSLRFALDDTGPSPAMTDQCLEADNAPLTVDDERAQISFRLIATSDLHACMLPYDYCADRIVTGCSLSDISRQIAVARAETSNSILLDNGDFLQGSPLADYVASTNRRRRAHPVITAFNTLGYDAVTLGNHEFNYGLEFLTTALSQAHFPVISANIVTQLGKSPAHDKTFVPPFIILKRAVTDQRGFKHTLRVGVIGFAPPQIEVWDSDQLNGQISMRGIIAAARAWLPRLRACGADVIVALAHSGIGTIDADDSTENAAAALAALPEIDAVIAGHSHLTFPGPNVAAGPGIDPVLGLLAGKPAVMPGHSGSHLGVIDLRLTRAERGNRRWIVSGGEARLGARTNASTPAVRLLRHALAPDHRAALAWTRKVLAECRVDLTTHFATTAPSALIDLIAEAKVDYARRALAGTDWDGLPLLAAAAPFRAGGRGGPSNFVDIPAGTIRMRNLLDLYLFPNTIVTLALSGAEVADWLEHSAAIFRQIAPGETDSVLHDASMAPFTFDAIPGLDYGIDLSQPARFGPSGRLMNPQARRIVGLSYQGRPVQPDQQLLLVTSNHRASLARAGGAGRGPQVALADGTRIQKVLEDHFRAKGVIGSRPRRSWHFLRMPGTTVRVAAGIGAEAHLGMIASLRPEPIGKDDEGFTHYRLHL